MADKSNTGARQPGSHLVLILCHQKLPQKTREAKASRFAPTSMVQLCSYGLRIYCHRGANPVMG